MTHVQEWKTALSTAKTDEESFRFFLKNGISAVEISMKWDLYAGIDWPAVQSSADATGMELWSLHLPFSGEINIASPDEKCRCHAVQVHCGLIEKGAAIGITRYVVHPSAEPIADEERPAWMNAAKKSLSELAQHAARYGSVICVEDLPRTCLGNTADEMLELLTADDRLRVCFDVNHLLTTAGCTHQEFVDKLGSKIVTTHMSDYDFVDEKHFFAGNGMLDWKMVIEALEAADYSGPFLFEGGFAPNPKMPEVPIGKHEEAHERHLQIKSFRGRSSL